VCCTIEKPRHRNIFRRSTGKIIFSVVLDGTKIDIIGGPVYDKEREFVKFPTQTKLTVGNNYTLDVGYEGPLQNDLAGLYYSSYDEVDSNTNTVTKRYVLYIILCAQHLLSIAFINCLSVCLSV